MKKNASAMTMEQLLDSGKDLLTEQLLHKHRYSIDTIKPLLPEITLDDYYFLSGASSCGSVLVDHCGRLYDQESGHFTAGRVLANQVPFFSPESIVPGLDGIRPVFHWEPSAPVLGWEYQLDDEKTQMEAFVPASDTGAHPEVWILVRQRKQEQEIWSKAFLYCMGGLNENCSVTSEERKISAYHSMRKSTIAWWKNHSFGNNLSIPDSELLKLYQRILIQAQQTFCGNRPKYGHAYYGAKYHDNFPPNFITMIEAACVSGNGAYALEVIQYILRYCVEEDGSFAYYGPSAAEYGQFLWILERTEAAVREWGTLVHDVGAIRKLADHLLSMMNDEGLIASGAEADTRFRVAVYANNNLWAIRGLEAANALISRLAGKTEKYAHCAAELKCRILSALEKEAVQSAFGQLVPFRLGYPALPWSLSSCRETTVPLAADTLEHYLDSGYPTGDIAGEQDLSENTYANYRYYVEMLSSRILPAEWEQAIVSLRRNAGGEFLVMTRLFRWLDDWPVFNYARFLLETGDVEHYQILLYSHACHHGRMDMGTYYEQVNTMGKAVAEDCIPSLLLPVLMLNWMGVYEPVAQKSVYLGKAIPKEWYLSSKEISFSSLTRWGKIHWSAIMKANFILLHAELPPMDAPVYWWAPIDILDHDERMQKLSDRLFVLPVRSDEKVVLDLALSI